MLAQSVEQAAQVEPHLSVLRIKTHCSARGIQRLPWLPLRDQQSGQVVVRAGVFGIDPKRRLQRFS
jgi:hypothetical protein